VRNYYQSGQRTAIVLHTGERIEFKARNKKRGRGFSAPRVILDEAMFLTDSMMGALFPTMAAQSMGAEQGQIIYTGSAALEESAVWRRVQTRAKSGADAARLAYAEWSVDPDSYDVHDVDGWYQANPSLGLLISEEFVADEIGEIGEAEFIRERLGVPDPDPAEGGDLALSLDAWNACFDGRSPGITDGLTLALDVSYDGSFASIAAAGLRADGLTHVEVFEYRPDGEWVVDRCIALSERWGAPLVVDPSGNAQSYLPDLRAAEVPLVELKSREVAGACVRFARAVAEGKIRHLGTGELSAAVATAVRQPVGDAFKFRRRVIAAPDLSPLYAVTLAAWPQDAEPALPTIF
jgi:hypothetical protein